MALIPAVVLGARIAKSEVVRVPTADGGEWSITITPATRSVATTAVVPAQALTSVPSQQVALTPIQYVQAPAAPDESAAPVPVAPEPVVLAEPVENESGIAIVPYPSNVPPQVSAYKNIYDAIPFNRTEYLANPSYRQEMAMELLTGNQRQIVVHRNYTPQLNQPTKGHPLFLYNRYGGYLGGGAGYGGPGPYGFGYGINYGYGYGDPPAFRYFLPLEDLY